MPNWLRQSTAVTVKAGPFLDDVDGKTPESALTIQKADVMLAKGDANYVAANADQGALNAGAAYAANGEYNISLDATDTGTCGRLRLSIIKAGALPVWGEFMIVPGNVYDSLVAGTDKLQADVVEAMGTAADASAGRFNVSVSAVGGIAVTQDGVGRLSVNAAALGGTAIAAGAATNWHTLYGNDGGVSTLFLDTIGTLKTDVAGVLSEVQKVPRQGTTYKHTNTSTAATATVTIAAP